MGIPLNNKGLETPVLAPPRFKLSILKDFY